MDEQVENIGIEPTKRVSRLQKRPKEKQTQTQKTIFSQWKIFKEKMLLQKGDVANKSCRSETRSWCRAKCEVKVWPCQGLTHNIASGRIVWHTGWCHSHTLSHTRLRIRNTHCRRKVKQMETVQLTQAGATCTHWVTSRQEHGTLEA